jgi:hypothetical protein
MFKDPLSVLESLLDSRPSKATRLTELLRNPEEDYTLNWYLSVPKCFNDALDIKKTVRTQHKQEKLVWTQGSAFSFKVGDTFYDTASAYSLPWSQALNKILFAIQIKKVIDGVTNNNRETQLSANVAFEVYVPDENKAQLKKIGEDEISQQAFVRFLISGPEGNLKNIIPNKTERS